MENHNDKYSDGDYQDAVGNMVSREVYYCVSTLISDLYNAAASCSNSGIDYDELTSVMVRYIDNSEEIEEVEEKISDWENMRDDTVEELEELETFHTDLIDLFFAEHDREATPADLPFSFFMTEYCEYQIAHVEAMTEHAITKLEAEKDDLEAEQDDSIEAYEHWIVSDWLADKLHKRGEMVEEIHGLTVWGRCTTGQSIYLDRVICDIYDDLHGE